MRASEQPICPDEILEEGGAHLSDEPVFGPEGLQEPVEVDACHSRPVGSHSRSRPEQRNWQGQIYISWSITMTPTLPGCSSWPRRPADSTALTCVSGGHDGCCPAVGAVVVAVAVLTVEARTGAAAEPAGGLQPRVVHQYRRSLTGSIMSVSLTTGTCRLLVRSAGRLATGRGPRPPPRSTRGTHSRARGDWQSPAACDGQPYTCEVNGTTEVCHVT